MVLSQFTKQHQENGGGDGCADVWMIFFLCRYLCAAGSRALALGPTSLLVTLESDRDLPVMTVNQQFDSE